MTIYQLFNIILERFTLFLEDYGQDYRSLALTAVIFIIPIVLIFFLGKKMLYLFPWIWKVKFNGKENIPAEDLQNDIKEIQKATDQIVKDWLRMIKLVSQMQNDQKDFVSRLQSMFETKNKMLEEKVNVSLKKVFKRNDQTYQEMKLRIEAMQEDIQCMKTDIQFILQISAQSESFEKSDEEKNTNSFLQTESEIRNETRVDEMLGSLRKNGSGIECDTSKLMAIVKASLTDIFKDAKLNLSIDREVENREMEIILKKLAEDREDIKRTILEAFSITSKQSKEVYDKFGQTGEDVLKYIAFLNDNNNSLLKEKFDVMDDVLKNILSVVNRQTHDIVIEREVIENIDGKFEELFKILTQIHQINFQQRDEFGVSLVRSSNNCVKNISKVEKMTKQLCDDTELVKQIFQQIKGAFSPQKEYSRTGKEKGEVVQNTAFDSTTIQAQKKISQKQENMSFVYSSWERIRNNVEDRCHSACELISELEQKIGSLIESIEKLDIFIRELNLDVLAERVTSTDFNSDTAEIADDIMQMTGDAGDGHSQVITSRLRNASIVQKFQNVLAVQNAMKLTDKILVKVGEKRNCQDYEKTKESKANNLSSISEESSSTVAAEEEPKSQNPVEFQV